MTVRHSLTPHWKDDISHVRVMAMSEGYVMVRRPLATPFVMHITEFTTKFQPTKPPKTSP